MVCRLVERKDDAGWINGRLQTEVDETIDSGRFGGTVLRRIIAYIKVLVCPEQCTSLEQRTTINQGLSEVYLTNGHKYFHPILFLLHGRPTGRITRLARPVHPSVRLSRTGS